MYAHGSRTHRFMGMWSYACGHTHTVMRIWSYACCIHIRNRTRLHVRTRTHTRARARARVHAAWHRGGARAGVAAAGPELALPHYGHCARRGERRGRAGPLALRQVTAIYMCVYTYYIYIYIYIYMYDTYIYIYICIERYI